MHVMEVKNGVTEYRVARPEEIAEMQRIMVEMPVPEPDPTETRMQEIEAALIELAAILGGA